MTAQPTREELLAAIVEWHEARQAANADPSLSVVRRTIDARDVLDAIARAELAERAEGKGHAGA